MPSRNLTAKSWNAEKGRRLAMQALAVLVVTVFIGGLGVQIYYAALPYAGFELSGPLRIGAVVPGSPAEAAGLKTGDEVLTVEGEPFRRGRPYLHPGQEILRLTVSRDGQTMPVEMALVRPSLEERFFTSSHLLVALAFWLVALAVLAFKPRDDGAQLFVLVMLLGVLVLVVWLLADLGLAWANMLMASLVIVIGPLFVHLQTLFPKRFASRGRGPLLAAVYGAGLFLLILSNVSDLAYYLRLDGEGGWLASLSLTPLIGAFFSGCMLIGLALLVRNTFFAGPETSRRQGRLVLLGTAMAVLPFVVFIALPQIFAAPYVLPTWLVLLALTFVPLSYGYAMYRRDLLRLDGAINRGVVVYLLALILIGLYVGIWLAFDHWLPGASPAVVTGARAALFAGLVLLVDPLKQRLQVFVDRVFYGGWYDYRSFISRTSEVLWDALDVAGIVEVVEQHVIGTMRFTAFALLLPDEEDSTFSVRGSRGFSQVPAVGQKGALPSALREVGKPLEHTALCNRVSVRSASWQHLAAWSEAGAQLWVPLVQQDELLGMLVLGSKQADDFVTQGDLEILSTFAQQTAMAISHLQLIDALQVQVDEVRFLGRQLLALQERNQHRLSRELHDLVLQHLITARHLLERAPEVLAAEEVTRARRTLLELTAYVRSIMFELRAPSWDDTDLQTALEDYALAFEDKGGLPVDFQVSGDDPGEAMSDEVRTAVYRICQESLTNVWKHAQAQKIVVRLDLQPDRVRLEVHDDGVGFEVPPYLGNHIAGGRLGLVSMRERAEEVGGSWVVESAPDKGTRVVVTIPGSDSKYS